MGKVVASLVSNVVGKAFTHDHHTRFHEALSAASAGRSGHNCAARFRKCSPGFRYTQEANTSHMDASKHSEDDDGHYSLHDGYSIPNNDLFVSTEPE